MNTVNQRHRSGFSVAQGFTLLELLVVIGIIAILASMLLPALVRAKQKAQGLQCLNNHRQLTLAWSMYAHDNEDRLPLAGSVMERSWVNGHLDFDVNNPSNWDITRDIKHSVLFQYCKNAAVFKCPADRSRVKPSAGIFVRQSVPRVRSMVMNYWFGGHDGKGWYPQDAGWRLYRRIGDLVSPGPAKTFLFLDQSEDTISGGAFYVDMTGYPDQPGKLQFTVDFPAYYHNLAAGLSFADGHSEIKKWLDARTTPPIKTGNKRYDEVPSPGNPDIAWLQERATRREQ